MGRLSTQQIAAFKKREFLQQAQCLELQAEQTEADQGTRAPWIQQSCRAAVRVLDAIRFQAMSQGTTRKADHKNLRKIVGALSRGRRRNLVLQRIVG